MIVITPSQMQQFNKDVRTRFAVRLTEQLRPDYPELFQILPQGLAQRMVAGKIDYAEERYEIHYQNALTTYLHYCCAIGPAFDLQPEIQAVLDDLSLYPDDIPDRLPELVSDAAWADAAQKARRRGWFASDPARLPDQVAARTCWAMAALAAQQSRAQAPPDEMTLNAFIGQSMQMARRHQIIDAAGMTAFAVCQSLLGKDFYLMHAKPWLAPIFSDPAILPTLRGVTLAGCVELEWGIEL
ncbi:MAG: hypothetical protein M8364_16100 [Methylobacter sp.]|uniref:hypothetical protein n=1 Tax=Methylobacter sp. TaxID=2051955 RepID=UPI00258716C2|nr:hypothetical protein [Methylobacter sp.]MCL7422413.1 hypothetical protein [Methylobacter sp.]